MNSSPRLLVVDDDPTFRETLAARLRSTFPDVAVADSIRECLAQVRAQEPDIALVDLHLPDGDGLDLVEQLRRDTPLVEIIVVTGFGTVDAAVAAMRRGAGDFVTKPLNLEALNATIRRAAERRELQRENTGLRRMLARSTPTLVGESAAMEAVRESARRAATSDAPVLITGPSGCGKELVARMIHAASARAGRDMLVVNAAALSETLLESELFGHERGAFTGATRQTPGLLEAAHGTTLFLDEIGELPLALQAKLLRAIQFGEVRRVGGSSTLRVDVRFIAATNRDLAKAVVEGAFREDLYYRLNVLAIAVPALRERPDDIEPTLRALAKRAGLACCFEEEHLRVLRSHTWPGNVRELENLVERLKILADAGPPTPERLLSLLGADALPAGGASSSPIRPLAVVEQEAIERALAAFGGDRQAAAAALGISVRKLYYRIANYRGEADAD